MTDQAWPFEDAKNTAVFTTKEVINDGADITYVTHDIADGAWQFHATNETADLDDARVVGLSTILQKDPTVAELADMPPGWHAWRAAKGAEWTRAPR